MRKIEQKKFNASRRELLVLAGNLYEPMMSFWPDLAHLRFFSKFVRWPHSTYSFCEKTKGSGRSSFLIFTPHYMVPVR